MVKYKQIFHEMIEHNKSLFDTFKNLNDEFSQHPDLVKDDFNRTGERVLTIIRKYENQLVGSTERSIHGKYSTKLSEQFWSLIRAYIPKIDYVGMK